MLIQKIIVTAVTLILISSPALAYSEGTTLTGQVVAFDDREISILSGDSKVILPRKHYSKKVEIGEHIKITVTDAEFEKIIKTSQKAIKNKSSKK